VFGIAPPSNPLFNTTFLVAGSIPIAYPAPGLEGQVYNGTQISILSDCYGLILDYALVTPGGTTNLEGSTIFLDDSNSEIKWDHNWNSTLHTTPATLSTGYPGDVFKGVFDWHRTPHNNSTHDSSIVGASFAFQFAGQCQSTPLPVLPFTFSFRYIHPHFRCEPFNRFAFSRRPCHELYARRRNNHPTLLCRQYQFFRSPHISFSLFPK
jgi:hypothetical protein